MRLASAFLGCSLLLAIPAAADDARDHDIAREAVQRGELLPLSTILATVARDYPGRVLEIELDRGEGRYEYEIEVLLKDGRVMELKYDGRTGRLIESELDD